MKLILKKEINFSLYSKCILILTNRSKAHILNPFLTNRCKAYILDLLFCILELKVLD